MEVYHATTADKLKRMITGRIGVGKKWAFFTTDRKFAYSFCWKRQVGRGNQGVILICEVDKEKAVNYHKTFWKTRERPYINGVIKPFRGV